MWRTFIALAALVAVGVFLFNRYRRESQRRQREPARFYARALAVLERAELQATGAVGYPRLAGRYQGFPVQIQPVIDTLATRRLPALWLLVTLQDSLPVAARLDLMTRPTAATTFSNFDLLPVTLQLPAGFPEHSVLRTDDPQNVLPARVLAPHLDLFQHPRAKELLITPNGVRLVWLIAEADRARYGVFREADFGESDLDPELLRDLLDRLVALRHSVIESMRKAS